LRSAEKQPQLAARNVGKRRKMRQNLEPQKLHVEVDGLGDIVNHVANAHHLVAIRHVFLPSWLSHWPWLDRHTLDERRLGFVTMAGKENLAERFEASRRRLKSVAYRMLGSHSEAEDAVQEAFLRVDRAGAGGIDNFEGWLTTIVARVCLDMLRGRTSRREVPVDGTVEMLPATGDPEHERLIADSIGAAMLIVLETLSPAERVAFVLHDIFNVSFDEIAPVVGRSPAAARQLASRGRRRVQGAPADPHADRMRQREVVSAFLAASQGGDFAALLTLLDPDVVLHADAAAIAGATAARPNPNVPTLVPETQGRDAVANVFRNRAKSARLALLDGVPGLVFAFPPGHQVRMIADIVVEDGRIVEISLIADADRVAAFGIEA
jgi:RNA polymerase sigma-70 factor (ECF subfamily)